MKPSDFHDGRKVVTSRPARALSKVVLPLPEGPISTFNLPGRKTEDTGPTTRVYFSPGRTHDEELVL